MSQSSPLSDSVQYLKGVGAARAEVETLNRSRDQIPAELGQLSGVIEALALTADSSEPDPAATPGEPAAPAGSEHEEEDTLT